MISIVLPAMLEAPLLQPTSTYLAPVQSIYLLILRSQRLPRQHSSTKLQRLVGAACPCTDIIYAFTLSLVSGSLPASYL